MNRPCRACGESDLAEVFALERAPHDVSFLLTPEQVEGDAPARLDVRRCGRCGHVQLAQDPDPDYYDEYLMTVTHSAQMRAYQQSQAAAFVERFALAGRRVVEVGCGDGHYLSILRGLGVRVSGVEPSARFREAAGGGVYPGYVTEATPVPGGPYDAFVTRQVLEHVPDPHDFLTGVRVSLTADGVGLVEVPSLEQALEHRRFYDFFPDHVSYWSVGTLGRALESNGFLVLEITRTMNGEYLQALVRVDSGRDLTSLRESVVTAREAMTTLLDGFAADGLSVAAWGAGGKGVASLAEIGAHGVQYVVDSDPHKQGRLMPVSHLPVVSPEHLAAHPVDVILLTALAYRDEILEQLRGPLAFAGTIAVLGDPVELLSGQR